jgi:predicted RNA-binding Zn-ribbon protein involved in translation (DUF1610 family)
MADVTAMRKHPCPECGGDAIWNAAKQALACPYCGTVLPWNEGQPQIGENIFEHDLCKALHEAHSRDRAQSVDRKAVKCQSCHAISEFESTRVAQNCDFCGSPSIVPADNLPDAIMPESVLPAKFGDPQVRDLLRKWYDSRWFAPNRLKKAALTDTLHGIYLPYWTFDAHVNAAWTAESGEYYYTTETRRGSDGQAVQVQVQQTRWYSSAGNLEHFFDDDLVPGTAGLLPNLLGKIEPFPTKDLRAYDAAYIRGWTVERYQVDLRKAADVNITKLQSEAESLCAAQVPGDTYRGLQVNASFDHRTFKHILVPVWVVSYTYGSRNFQVVTNGYTGLIAGDRPYSWIKIALFTMMILMILLIIWYLQN